MKQMSVIALLFISSLALAGSGTIARYVQAEIGLLQNEIVNLQNAIKLLNSGLSAKQRYEQIALPGFTSSNKVLAQNGFTVKSYYRFQSENQWQIQQWLSENASQAEQIKHLSAQRDQLIQVIDGVNQ